MLKTYLEFTKDGRTICVPSQDGKGAAIQSCTLTECVNSGEELTIGSVCACSLEATLMLLDGDLNIAAGDTVAVYKQLDNNTPTKVGVFVLERPTRVTANTMKITGFDYVSKLDKDLTAWLAGLKEWPYTLTDFAGMVCEACGLDYTETDVPNKDFQVQKFTRTSVTGRQLMRWLGEICCSFCRADRDGNIEFAWYADSGVEITTCGEPYYFQNGLTFENYTVTPVGAVQLRLADSENGALWPTVGEDTNSYIITGNSILNREITEGLGMCLEAIHSRLENAVYTPCRVEIPANVKINAGDIVKITDKNGKTITTYVMTKTQSGQKDILESTGSALRDSSSAVNNKTQQEISSENQSYASVQAQKNAREYAEDVFDKLTNGRTIQGIYAQDGKWYINAETIATGILQSKDGANFYLNLDNGELKMNAKEFSVSGQTVKDIADESAKEKAQAAVAAQTQEDIFNKLTKNGTLSGLFMQKGQLYVNASYLRSGTIDASVVNVINLIAQKLISETETSKLDIDGSAIRLKTKGVGETFTIYNYDDGEPRVYLVGYDESGNVKSNAHLGSWLFGLGGSDLNNPNFLINASGSSVQIGLPNGVRTASWRDNGDGTFTLIGQ